MNDNDRELIIALNKRIDQLILENEQLKQENASYKMWMDRSINRVKEIQCN